MKMLTLLIRTHVTEIVHFGKKWLFPAVCQEHNFSYKAWVGCFSKQTIKYQLPVKLKY